MRWTRLMHVAMLALGAALSAHLAWGTDTLAEAVTRLQPRLSARSAASYARAFEAAGQESSIDPLLLVAIAYRESSFHPAVARGQRTGSLGEVGLMQVHPRGFARSFAPDCAQSDPACSIVTAARFLDYLRQSCGGSWWVWVAAYQRSSCPSEAAARRSRGARRARELYLRVGGEGWR